MHERGDRRHHHQHHGRKRVDAKLPIHAQVAGVDPVEHRNDELVVGAGQEADEDRPAQRRSDEQRSSRNGLRRSRPNPASAEPSDDGRQQRQENNCLHHQPCIRLTSSTAIEPRRRKKMTRMARPMAASAAATVRTNIAITCPTTSPRKAEKATRLMFTASRISSIAISIRMTLRRLRKMPSTPRTNRIAATVRKWASEITA